MFGFVVLIGFSKLEDVSGEAWLGDGEIDEELEGEDEHEGFEKLSEVVMVTSSLVETGGVILLVRLLTLAWRFSRQVEILDWDMLLS